MTPDALHSCCCPPGKCAIRHYDPSAHCPRENMTMPTPYAPSATLPELPPLPQPRSITDAGNPDMEGWWTLDQMRAYARLAVSQALAARDEHWKTECDVLEQQVVLSGVRIRELVRELDATVSEPDAGPSPSERGEEGKL